MGAACLAQGEVNTEPLLFKFGTFLALAAAQDCRGEGAHQPFSYEES